MVDGKIALITGAGQGSVARSLWRWPVRRRGRRRGRPQRGDRGADGRLVRDGRARTPRRSSAICATAIRSRPWWSGTVARFGGLDVSSTTRDHRDVAHRPACRRHPAGGGLGRGLRGELRAVWLATKFAAPHLRRSTRGPNIVNAASVSGLTAFPLGPDLLHEQGRRRPAHEGHGGRICARPCAATASARASSRPRSPAGTSRRRRTRTRPCASWWLPSSSIGWARLRKSRSSRASWPPTTRPSSRRGLSRRRRSPRVDRHPMTGREVHVVRYPRGEVRESDFRVVASACGRPGARRGAGAQHVDVGRCRTPAAAAREGASRLLRGVPPRARHGRDRDRR
jgi:hypothetical protein